MSVHFYIFTIVIVESLSRCGGRQRQYLRKSMYYPYKTTHKSIYLNFRRQYDYDYNDESTTSIYLPDLNQNITTIESTTASGYTESPLHSPLSSSITSIPSSLDPNTSDNTSGINTSESSTYVVNNTLSVTTSDVVPSILTSATTITQVFEKTESFTEDTSPSSAVTASLILPPTFEPYFPSMKTETTNNSYLITTTTQNPVVKEVKQLSQNHGHFAASSMVLLNTLVSMNRRNVRCLLDSMNYQVERLESEKHFSMFEGKPTQIFLLVIQALTVEPEDVMKDHIRYAIYAIENRNAFLTEDVNVLFDIVDTVYLERDGEDVAKVVEDMKSLNCSTSDSVVQNLLNTFIFTPFQRVQGTARENVILAGMKQIIDYRFKDIEMP